MGAARPGACGSLFAASRFALGAEGVGAARPGAYMLSPPPQGCTLEAGVKLLLRRFPITLHVAFSRMLPASAAMFEVSTMSPPIFRANSSKGK